MRILVITRDARFLEALQRQDPDFVTFLGAADAAAALRACRTEPVSGAVLDGALPATVWSEFLRWWQAWLDRRALPLLLAGGDANATLTVTAIATPADAGAVPQALGHVLPRDASAVARALAARTACWLDAERQELRGATGCPGADRDGGGAVAHLSAGVWRRALDGSGAGGAGPCGRRGAGGAADACSQSALQEQGCGAGWFDPNRGPARLPGGRRRFADRRPRRCGALAERRGHDVPDGVQGLNRGETVQPFGPVQRVLLERL